MVLEDLEYVTVVDHNSVLSGGESCTSCSCIKGREQRYVCHDYYRGPSPYFGQVLSQPFQLFGPDHALILIVVVVLVRGKGKPAAKPSAGAKPEAGAAAGVAGAAVGVAGAAVAGPQPTVSKELSDLQNYVNQAMMQGYAVDDIRTHLLEIGWDQTTADSVVEKAQENMQRQ